jgi:precorrin-6B methylase 2
MKRLVARGLKLANLDQAGVMLGYLRRSGWIRSLWNRKPQDGDGQPLPWYSYPSIHFLASRPAPATVFEYGSGNSTLWWAKRANRVVSVEDDVQWHGYVSKSAPANVTYTLATTADEYVNSLTGRHNLIVVDGSHRERCISSAIEHLTDCGVLVVDNSDWPHLAESLSQAERAGFRRIEFYGLAPCNGHPHGTSILYRAGNFLGL